MKVNQFIANCKHTLENAGVNNTNEVYFIIEHVLGLSRADLVTLDSFSPVQEKAINKAISKRIKGKSLQMIIGYTNFVDIKIIESKHTLTPRPETEYMTSLILKEKECKVLDMCAGSGAIGITLAKHGFDVTLADVSVKCIRMIKRNLKENGAHAEVIKSNMFGNIDGIFDIIVSNPPYIPSKDVKLLEKDVLINDPILALDGGKDGLNYYVNIAENAWQYLSNAGVLYLEIGIGQEKSVQKLLEKHYKNITIIKDLSGINRIIRAEKQC